MCLGIEALVWRHMICTCLLNAIKVKNCRLKQSGNSYLAEKSFLQYVCQSVIHSQLLLLTSKPYLFCKEKQRSRHRQRRQESPASQQPSAHSHNCPTRFRRARCKHMNRWLDVGISQVNMWTIALVFVVDFSHRRCAGGLHPATSWLRWSNVNLNMQDLQNGLVHS